MFLRGLVGKKRERISRYQAYAVYSSKENSSDSRTLFIDNERLKKIKMMKLQESETRIYPNKK